MKPRYCDYCGAKTERTAKICPSCGMALHPIVEREIKQNMSSQQVQQKSTGYNQPSPQKNASGQQSAPLYSFRAMYRGVFKDTLLMDRNRQNFAKITRRGLFSPTYDVIDTNGLKILAIDYADNRDVAVLDQNDMRMGFFKHKSGIINRKYSYFEPRGSEKYEFDIQRVSQSVSIKDIRSGVNTAVVYKDPYMAKGTELIIDVFDGNANQYEMIGLLLVVVIWMKKEGRFNQ